jgi:hypothetical protein
MKKAFFVNIFLMTILMVLMFAMNVLAASSPSAYTTGQAISVSVVNQNPDPATAGDVVEVRLGIENYGSASLENMIVEVLPSYPFESVPEEPTVQSVGSVNSYQSGSDVKIVKFDMRVNKDAVAGTYDLNVRYYSQGDEADSQTKTVSVDVSSTNSAEIIHIDKTLLVPGEQSGLKFTIHNVGSAPLRDMTFYWVNNDKAILPVGSDNTQYIKYLDVGASVDMDYQVIADTNANSGLYTLNLYLTYMDPLTSAEKTISTIAGVYVGGGTNFDVAFSDSTTGTTSFTIANTGSNPASSVSVMIPEQNNWRVSGTNSMIIGNLNKGDYTVASFKLQRASFGSFNSTGNGANPNAARNFTNTRNVTTRSMDQLSNALIIQIVYTDTLGAREMVEKTVQILSLQNSTTAGLTGAQGMYGRGNVSQKSFFAKYKWYIFVVVLFIGGILFWQYRRRVLMNKDVKLKDIFKGKRK